MKVIMGNIRYILLDREEKEIFPGDETWDEAMKHKERLEQIKPQSGPFTIIPIESHNIQPVQVVLV